MKHFLLGIAFFLIYQSQAQTASENRKYIEVTGSAEMTVQPDEIVLEVIIGNYEKAAKSEKGKSGIETIEDQFNAVMKKNNIKSESVHFDSTSFWYWMYWWDYRYRDIDTRTVTITLDKKTNIMQLVQDLNTKWTSSIRIVSTKSNEIARFRKEVKIESIKAAKIKATYLLESVGEAIGGILSVDEMPEQSNNYGYLFLRDQNQVSNSNMGNRSSNSGDGGIENVKEIKLRYEIKVKFEIK